METSHVHAHSYSSYNGSALAWAYHYSPQLPREIVFACRSGEPIDLKALLGGDAHHIARCMVDGDDMIADLYRMKELTVVLRHWGYPEQRVTVDLYRGGTPLSRAELAVKIAGLVYLFVKEGCFRVENAANIYLSGLVPVEGNKHAAVFQIYP